MNPRDFALNFADYGIPTREELVALRIWDSHFHGFLSSGDPIEQFHKVKFYVERMGIERSISLEVGGTLGDPLKESGYEEEQRKLLAQESSWLSGITPIDPGFPEESCAKMIEWIRNGPCVGIKYVGGNKRGITVDHPNNDPIIRLAAELDAMIYVHTWIKIGGSPRHPGGGNNPGESTPMDLAKLAQRYPEVPLICGHSGGDWELGVRAVRPYPNIYFEFTGSDPHSGSVEYAVRELGADRIVWGGHGPSRSYATELGKVLDADIGKADRMKIFGGNYRRLAAAIFKKKGQPIKL